MRHLCVVVLAGVLTWAVGAVAQGGEPAELGGEVFRDDGAPAPGVRVIAVFTSPRHVLEKSEARTDDRGAFSFSLVVADATEPVFVLAHKPDLGGDLLGILPGQRAELQLHKPGPPRKGIVQDAQGRPIAGAVVTHPLYVGHYISHDLSPLLPDLLWTVTDHAGGFSHSDPFSSWYADLRVSAAGFATIHRYLRNADEDPLRIVLPPEGTIVGRVMHGGKPVAGVTVFCHTQYGQGDRGSDEAVTDARGRYRLGQLGAGKFNVLVRPWNNLVASALRGVAVEAGQRAQAPDMELAPGGIVRGRVVDADSLAPISGVSVRVHHPGSPPDSQGQEPVFTDDQGRYEARVAAGETRVRVINQPVHGRWYKSLPEDHIVQVRNRQTVAAGDLHLPPSGPAPPNEPRPAKPGDLALSVDLPDGATISAYEPVVATVRLASRATEPVTVADCGTLTTRVEVRDQRGYLVAATERPEMPADVLYGNMVLRPDGTKSRSIIVSGLHVFREPGEYLIRVQQLELSHYFPVLAEGAATLRVEPFDAARLRARCEQLTTHAAQNARVLYSVQHDVALPYLERMAVDWADSYACRAMRRINSEASRQVLARLSARNDDVGEAARNSAKPPGLFGGWGMLGDWSAAGG